MKAARSTNDEKNIWMCISVWWEWTMFVLVGGAYFVRRLDRRRPTFHFSFCCVTTRGQRFRIKKSPSFRNFKIIPFEYYQNSFLIFLSDWHKFPFEILLSSENFTGPDINVLGCLQPIVSPSISSYEQVIINFET